MAGKPKEIFETKFAVPRGESEFILSLLRMKAEEAREFPQASIRTCYFDDGDRNSFFESRDGHLHKRKYRLREYMNTTEGARYSLEVKVRNDSRTSKIRRLIYEPLPEGYRFTTFRDLIETFERVTGENFNDIRAGSTGGDLFLDAVISYERRRFDDPFSGARYNLDTEIKVATGPDPCGAFIYLGHDIFEIKSPFAGPLPGFLKGTGAELTSFSKFAWGRGIFS